MSNWDIVENDDRISLIFWECVTCRYLGILNDFRGGNLLAGQLSQCPQCGDKDIGLALVPFGTLAVV